MSLQPLDTTNEIPDAYKLALSESRRWYVAPPPLNRLIQAYLGLRVTVNFDVTGTGNWITGST